MIDFQSIDINALTDQYVVPWSINIALALCIFITGKMASGCLVNILVKVLSRSKFDNILIEFITSIVHTVLLLFVAIAALAQLGLNTSSLVALLGAAGLAIGLALQKSLQNFASGVLLLIFRPFKAGDVVEAGGVLGTVESISIFTSTFRTGDNKEIIIPNGKIYGDNIINYSKRATRRVDLVIGISYDSDLLKAKQILSEILLQDDRILDDPKPTITMAELADSSVNINVRPWVNSGDYWPVRSDMIEKIKLTFDEQGIVIPYPQMDVHINQVES